MDRLKRPWTYENYKDGEITIKKDTYDKLLARWNEPVTPNVTVVNKGVNRPTEHYVTTGNIRSTSMPYNAYPWRGYIVINLRAMTKVDYPTEIQYFIDDVLQRLFPDMSLEEIMLKVSFGYDIHYHGEGSNLIDAALVPPKSTPQMVFFKETGHVFFGVKKHVDNLLIVGCVYVDIAGFGMDKYRTAWLDGSGALKLSSDWLGFCAPVDVMPHVDLRLGDSKVMDIVRELSDLFPDPSQYGYVYIKQYQKRYKRIKSGNGKVLRTYCKRYRKLKKIRVFQGTEIPFRIDQLQRKQVYRLYMPKRRNTDDGYYVMWRYRGRPTASDHNYKLIEFKRAPKSPLQIKGNDRIIQYFVTKTLV